MNKKKPIENSKYVAGSMMTLLNFPRRSDAATIPYFCKHFFNGFANLIQMIRSLFKMKLSVLFLMGNLIADLILARVDPRIRYE